MMRATFAILAILSLHIFACPQKAVNNGTEYVNYEYAGVVPDSILPNGVKHLGGGLIGDIEADPVYGISQVSAGRMKMLWLETSTGRDAKGVTGWKVLDVLAFPNAVKNDYIFFYGDPSIQCMRKGKDVPNVVGIGRLYSSRGTFVPAKLWTADIKARRFVSTTSVGMKCVYSEP
jgi:hypothetical protein